MRDGLAAKSVFLVRTDHGTGVPVSHERSAWGLTERRVSGGERVSRSDGSRDRCSCLTRKFRPGDRGRSAARLLRTAEFTSLARLRVRPFPFGSECIVRCETVEHTDDRGGDSSAGTEGETWVDAFIVMPL